MDDGETSGAPLPTITVDRTLGHDSVCVCIDCSDRKGLLYDILRTTHTWGVLTVTTRLVPQGDGAVSIQLFLKDGGHAPLHDPELLRPLLHELHKAVLQPVCVSVRFPARRG